MGEAGEGESLTAVTDDVDDGGLEFAKNVRYDCSDRVLLVEGRRPGDGDCKEEEEGEAEWGASHVILSLSLSTMVVGRVEFPVREERGEDWIGLSYRRRERDSRLASG